MGTDVICSLGDLSRDQSLSLQNRYITVSSHRFGTRHVKLTVSFGFESCAKLAVFDLRLGAYSDVRAEDRIFYLGAGDIISTESLTVLRFGRLTFPRQRQSPIEHTLSTLHPCLSRNVVLPHIS